MKVGRGMMVLVGAVLVLLGSAFAQEFSDDQLGLEKSDVFATPDPIVPVSAQLDPGENALLGAYFEGSPPLVSHQIEDFMPITIGENACLDCHDNKGLIGEELAADDPVPMPASHYTDLRRDPEAETDLVIGARYVCSQCHAAQMDAQPLVANTYKQ